MIKPLFPILLLFIFLPLTSSALVITEVQIEGEDVNDCFITIYNPSSKLIDLSNYNLRKKTSSGNDSSIRVFPQGKTIPSNGYFTWASSRNSTFPEAVNADVVSTQYLSRDNSIALMDTNRDIIDAVAWGEGDNPYIFGEPVENPEEGQTIRRIKTDGIYQNTENNKEDFNLYPPPPPPPKVKETITDYGEKDNINPLFIAIISSLILSIIIIYFYKKWPDTVTQKTSKDEKTPSTK